MIERSGCKAAHSSHSRARLYAPHLFPRLRPSRSNLADCAGGRSFGLAPGSCTGESHRGVPPGTPWEIEKGSKGRELERKEARKIFLAATPGRMALHSGGIHFETGSDANTPALSLPPYPVPTAALPVPADDFAVETDRCTPHDRQRAGCSVAKADAAAAPRRLQKESAGRWPR